MSLRAWFLSISFLMAGSAFAIQSPAYVRIGGVVGESKDSNHRDWFELVSLDQGPYRWTQKDTTDNFLPRESGSEGPGKMTVTRLARLGSPDIYRAATTGTYFGTVTVEAPIPSGMGKYVQWNLSDVVITKVNIERPQEYKGIPIEQITFAFQRAEWSRPEPEGDSFTPQRMHIPHHR